MHYALNYSVRGFCPLKIKIIAQFPDGLHLNLTFTEPLKGKGLDKIETLTKEKPFL